MRPFTIDGENNITVFASEKQAKTSNEADAVIFTSEDELAQIAAHWPTHRLVDIWNSLTGVTPVRKFTDRKTAIARIWKAIQSLEPAPEVPEKAAPAREVATGRAARSKATRKKAKVRKKAATGGQGAREGSKKAAVLELLRQPDGATLKDLMAATGWQAHSVRGFISGAIVRKMGLQVESQKRADGRHPSCRARTDQARSYPRNKSALADIWLSSGIQALKQHAVDSSLPGHHPSHG